MAQLGFPLSTVLIHSVVSIRVIKKGSAMEGGEDTGRGPTIAECRNSIGGVWAWRCRGPGKGGLIRRIRGLTGPHSL